METPLDLEPTPAARARPRAGVVLALFAATAGIFSYLAAYALTDALAAAEVICRWPRDADPRPRWMALWFTGMLAALTVGYGGVRWLGRRQMRRIEQLAEGEE